MTGQQNCSYNERRDQLRNMNLQNRILFGTVIPISHFSYYRLFTPSVTYK
uniref:Uncharacterized protein n=1 Tax=Arundo donax TaxID=35708 RepID=A0A0A8ZQT0_ARUDO